jgi:hypothetical protein
LGPVKSEYYTKDRERYFIIEVKTNLGIPRYKDSQESDVFLLAGAEDLVPIFMRDGDGEICIDKITGEPIIHDENRDGYIVRRYSPRIEGTYMRIERWTNNQSPKQGHIHWRTISGSNITSIFGRDENSRIYDPCSDTEEHIFSWLVAEQYDTRGNAIIYKYKAEDSIAVDTSQCHERNRTDKSRSSNRYLKTIHYGNKTPNRDLKTWEAFSAFSLAESQWMFTIAFDYGDFDKQFPKINDNGPWLSRKDPFSSCRSGFEIRTYRFCRRILMFHHFPFELSRKDCVVTSTNFTYNETDTVTYLKRATHVGWLLDDTGNHYQTKSLPPLDFEYSQFPTDEQLSQIKAQDIDLVSMKNLPYGVDDLNYKWVDLDGEGLSGVLTEQGGGWFYKRNLSANNRIPLASNPTQSLTIPEFGPLEIIYPKTSTPLDQLHFADVQGNGELDLVQMDNSVWGYYSRSYEGKHEWKHFHQFNSFPNISIRNPHLKFIDLTGDGLPDILISDDQAFVWYKALGEDGYGDYSRTSQSLDEENGPRLVFADAEQSIYLADMSGDGLTDLLRIRNGEVCYWPNTGYGVFGSKITMDNSPWFDRMDQFNQHRIHLADIDRSGTSDILYVGLDGVYIYLNQSGNRFGEGKRLSVFPHIDSLSTFNTVDLLGNGTTCLVWSSLEPGTTMKFVDIAQGCNPHMLIGKTNNLGTETRFSYAPSTKFYLDDKQSGRPWITRLPFPVNCVEKVEILDYIGESRFVNRYAYHHGLYDGAEREFRGFAMVEQWDAEEFMHTNQADAQKAQYSTWKMPPVYTKTWFHTGIYLDHGGISQLLANEYFPVPAGTGVKTALLADSITPSQSTYDQLRESCRAFKGHILRQEIYAQDSSQKASTPYTITESNYEVDIKQGLRDSHQHSIISVRPRETITINMERDVDDLRIQHNIVLQLDKHDNVLKSVQIAYGRGVLSGIHHLYHSNNSCISEFQYQSVKQSRQIDPGRDTDCVFGE